MAAQFIKRFDNRATAGRFAIPSRTTVLNAGGHCGPQRVRQEKRPALFHSFLKGNFPCGLARTLHWHDEAAQAAEGVARAVLSFPPDNAKLRHGPTPLHL